MACNQSWLELLDSSNSSTNDDLTQPITKLKTTFGLNHSIKTQEIEIIERANEKKFDKIKKSPFKRRLSNEKLPEVQIKVETPSRQKGKRSKIDVECEKIKPEPQNENDDDYELEEGELERTVVTSAKKRLRSESSDASSSNNSGNFQNHEIETDVAILERRQKQIDYGKNTAGYDNYIRKVPKHSRSRDHPKTPPKNLKYSRRAWEGLIKSWRRKLHKFDDDDEEVVGDDDNATGF